MRKKWLKAEYIPLWFSMAVMWMTLLIYVAGPIRFIDKWDFAEFITILLLTLYFLAFAAGYLLRGKRYRRRQIKQRDLTELPIWKKILSVSIWINLFLTVTNAQIYSSTTDIFSLFGQAIEGILSPGSVYFGKDASSRMGSVAIWITFLYSPLMYITNILSLYKFKTLTKNEKAAVVFTFVVEAARWLSVGTNKGLFDIVLLFVTFYLVLCMHYLGRPSSRTLKNKRTIRKITVIVLVALLLFFMFFSMAISSRVSGQYDKENYESFPYNLIPEGMRFFVDKAVTYLVHGYNNMERIIENCDFQWTFGVGNSRFTLQIVDKLLGTNLTGRTYPYQLQQYGVDPLVSWHSAYSWFASDLTFAGVIFLMFFAGYFMCGLAHDVVHRADPVAMALLYLMIMMVVNASCTNYVLAYTNGFAGFWGLFCIRWLQKHKRVRNKLWQLIQNLYAGSVRLYRKVRESCAVPYRRAREFCGALCHSVGEFFRRLRHRGEKD